MGNDESTTQDSHRSEAATKEIHEGPPGLDADIPGAPAKSQAQANAYRDEESHVDQPTYSGKEIQTAKPGILESNNRLPIPDGFCDSPKSATASSSEFVREKLSTATTTNAISRLHILDGTDGEESDSAVASEYFQGPNEAVQWSCQEYAGRLHIVHPDFRVPDSVRQHLQLQADPREEEIDIPVISLQFLMLEERMTEDDKFSVKYQISEACREWGVFQVRDHGIPPSLLERVLDVTRKFFDLPMEEKMLYSMLYNSDESGYGGRRSPECRLWGDHLLHVLQLEKSVHENDLPTNPPTYGENILRYAKLAMVLNMQLIDACAQVQDVDVTELEIALRDEYLKIIAKSYGTTLESFLSAAPSHASVANEGTTNQAIVTRAALRVNYHPPCPDPELVLGIDPCSARTAFEIVLQNEVPGLQIFQNGRWRTIKYIPDALTVFVGKALEIVSKEMENPYKAVQCRVVADRQCARISVTLAFGLTGLV